MYDAIGKYEMTLRQAQVDIGQGRGNSLSNAIAWIKDNSLYKDLKEEELKLKIEEIWDYLFHASQVKISKDYADWLKIHKEELIKHFNVRDIVENQGEKVIQLDKDAAKKEKGDKWQGKYNQQSTLDEANRELKEAEEAEE